jgi:hypothetical protein
MGWRSEVTFSAQRHVMEQDHRVDMLCWDSLCVNGVADVRGRKAYVTLFTFVELLFCIYALNTFNILP